MPKPSITRKLPPFLTILVLIPPIWKALQTSILPLVPAGDDTAYHVYYVIKASTNPMEVLNPQNNSQYPNIVHLVLAILFSATKNHILVAKTLGAWAVASIAVGFLLHAFLIRRASNSSYVEAASVMLMALTCYEVLLTLNDGTVMYIFDLMVLLPLAALAIISEKYLIAGTLLGLSVLSWAGILITSVFLLPLLIASIRKNNPTKPLLKMLIGTFAGGNIFILKLIAKIFNSLPNETFTALAGTTPLAPDFTFRLVILTTSILLAVLMAIIRAHHPAEDLKPLLASWTLIVLGCLIFLLLSTTPLMLNLHERFVRTAIFLLYIPLCYFFSLLHAKAKDILPTRMHSPNPLLLLTLFLVLLFSSQILLYQNIYGYPSGTLQRLDPQKLEAYAYIRNTILKNEKDTVILVLHQISPWAKPLLTIPERNISVFVLNPTYPSPNAKTCEKYDADARLTRALESLNVSTLKRFGIRYILIELPYQNQWYIPTCKSTAYHLWNKDFSPIADLVYQKLYDENGIKVWKIRY